MYGMKSVFHNNPNPFTGNEPGMGFEVIGPQPKREFGGSVIDRLEQRVAELERMLGVNQLEQAYGGGDSLAMMLSEFV